ncbi:class I SAM-dependent methyltransferase [Pseudonocardia sp. TRM90224]|uniref:class I SAM-dependent methyltransferase n=1 Tax=Pseudonocardia sp. TRM90224 TaxID=2812678 RepID=UPI001E48A26F|nr:methyltransferase domain-containing protein [Pseudonocardia sp. TRM90224]
MAIGEHRAFLRSVLRSPAAVGAPAPTGAPLAAAIARVVPVGTASTVVELGAGTGAISPAIRARLAPGSRYVAVEIDAELVAHLGTTMPWLEVLHGDAADLGELLRSAGVGPVDAVVSSLPWTLMPRATQQRLLAQIAAALGANGAFATISTLTALPARVKEFRSVLDATFTQVVATSPVWRNVPPSRVLICRSPRSC